MTKNTLIASSAPTDIGSFHIEASLLDEITKEVNDLPVIKSHADYTQHTVACDRANKQVIQLDKDRKANAKPFSDRVKLVNSIFRQWIDPLKAALDNSKQMRMRYDEAARKRLQARLDKIAKEEAEEQARLEKEAEEKDLPYTPPPPPVKAETKQATNIIGGSSKYVSRETYKITDIVALVKACESKIEQPITGSVELTAALYVIKEEIRLAVKQHNELPGMEIVVVKTLQDG